MPAKSVSVTLSDADPKNRVVKWTESSDDDLLRNIYFGKKGMKKLGEPSKIKVTVEAVDD